MCWGFKYCASAHIFLCVSPPTCDWMSQRFTVDALLCIYCFHRRHSHRLLQLRLCRKRSPPWQRASCPKKSPLLLCLHPLPGNRQKTLSRHLNPSQRGPRAPPSPCQPSQLTPSKARSLLALQKALTPSRLCPGPRASGLPSVIILLHLAVRAQALLWRSSRGLSLAPAGQVASSLMALLMPPAKHQAAERAASSVSLMSSLGLQTGPQQQLHRANYSMVTILMMQESCAVPEVCYFIFVLNFNCFLLHFVLYAFVIYFYFICLKLLVCDMFAKKVFKFYLLFLFPIFSFCLRFEAWSSSHLVCMLMLICLHQCVKCVCFSA